MAIPIAYNGRGTQLLYSLDGVNFTAVAQLQQFEPSGSKQTIEDQTNLNSPGNFTQMLAVQADGGEIDVAGVLNPGDITYLTLGQIHGNLTLAWWRALLVDGSIFSFQAFVSQFKPFAVKVNKLYTWSAKLRLSGGFQSPLGTFQPGTFDPLAFSTI